MERVDLPKSVLETPNYEEYYGLIDNEVDDEEFNPDNKDEKIKKMIAIALSLLQEFYLLHMYDTEFIIAAEEFEEEVNQLNIDLKDLLISLSATYVSEVQNELDIEYVLPTDTIQSDFDLEAVVESGVNAVTSQLYADLKNKADFYKDVAITTGMFSLHSNFRRAVKRLTNVIDYNAQYTRNRITRSYQEFVYGQEALFYWNVSGVNTCPWCYELEAMGAMPLSWWPVDHPNGNCWRTPVLPDVYSDEYIEIRGW